MNFNCQFVLTWTSKNKMSKVQLSCQNMRQYDVCLKRKTCYFAREYDLGRNVLLRLESRPIFIPNFAEKWDPFLYQSHKFEAKFTKNLTLFSKFVKFLSKFWKFWYQIDEIGPIFAPLLENFENMTHVYTSFCTEWGVIFIPGGWFWDPFQWHVPG